MAERVDEELEVLGCAGDWLQEFTDLRDRLNDHRLDVPKIRAIAMEMIDRIQVCGRTKPIPKLSDRARLRLERDAAVAQARLEQQREAAALRSLGVEVETPCLSMSLVRSSSGVSC